MGLVVEHPVDAERLPAQEVVPLLLARQAVEAYLPGLLHPLQLLHDPVGPIVGPRHADGHLQVVDDGLDVPCGVGHGHPEQLEGRVRHHDGVPVAGGDARDELAPVVAGQIVLGGHQDRGAGVQAHELGRVLLQHVVRHDVGRLGRQSQPPQFHAGCHHDGGLARTHRMEQPGVAGLHDAPDGVALVAMQFEAAGEPRQLQVRAVELALARAVEQVVVDPAQPLAALRVLVGPGREALLQHAQFLARRHRLRLVDDVGVAVGMRVADRRRLHVQRAQHQFDRVHAGRAELLRAGHVPLGFVLVDLDRPGAGLCQVLHGGAAQFQDLPDEGLDCFRRDPHRAEPGLDGSGWKVFGDHPFERPDVRLVGRARP